MGSNQDVWLEKPLDKRYKLVGDIYTEWGVEEVCIITIYIFDTKTNEQSEDLMCEFVNKWADFDHYPTDEQIIKRFGWRFNKLYSTCKKQLRWITLWRD